MTTVGEYRVGIDFNPSGDDKVNTIKQQAAHLIDYVNAIGVATSDPEIKRLAALAMTDIENGAMWAVKAATKKPSS